MMLHFAVDADISDDLLVYWPDLMLPQALEWMQIPCLGSLFAFSSQGYSEPPVTSGDPSLAALPHTIQLS